MKKTFLTAIIFGLLISQAACSSNSAFAAKLTRKQKKEATLISAAQASFDEKQYDVAIEYYTKAIEVNPQNADSYTKRGNAKCWLGHYKDAVKDYTKAIELDPNIENAYYNRGIAKSGLNAYEEVVEDYSKEIERNPENINAYLNRGTTKVLLKKYDDAILDFSKVI